MVRIFRPAVLGVFAGACLAGTAFAAEPTPQKPAAAPPGAAPAAAAAPAAPSPAPAPVPPTDAPAANSSVPAPVPPAEREPEVPAAPARAAEGSPGPASEAVGASREPAPKPIRERALPPDRTPRLEASAAEPDDGQLGTHQVHWLASIGARTVFVSSSGFDVFSSDNALTHVSFALGRVLYADGPWSVALGAAWDVGRRELDARGSPTTLSLHRLTVAPEVRYHLLRRLYGFGRLGGGITVLDAGLRDRIAGTERESDALLATFDPGAGLAFELAGPRRGHTRKPRFWLALDGGLVWTGETTLVFAGGDLPARAEDIDLGALSLTGPYVRLNLALTL